jgi:ABC-type sugar transport system permease subunit
MSQIAIDKAASSTEAPAEQPQRRGREVPYGMRVKGWDYAWIALFLAPFVILYSGFTLWPLIATVIYSFYDWNGIGPLTDFIGMENYFEIARSPSFWNAFTNTLVFATVNTIIKLPLSLFIAVLLTQQWMWGKRIWRTVFFAPLVIPVALAGLVFDFLLNTRGALNDVLTTTGILERPLDFLGNPETALPTLILISVWQIFGQYMIYWMAALQNVPESVYEAADMDGANGWQKLLFVTLPMIRPVAVIILFLSFVNALKVFGLVAATTEGGPGQSTYVVSYFIYNQAFRDLPFRYGYASAAAVLFGVTVLVAVTVQGYFVRRVGQSGGDES